MTGKTHIKVSKNVSKNDEKSMHICNIKHDDIMCFKNGSKNGSKNNHMLDGKSNENAPKSDPKIEHLQIKKASHTKWKVWKKWSENG